MAIDPKNSITDVPLFTFEFLFFSEGCKLSYTLGQCADVTANKPDVDPWSEVLEILLTQQSI